MRLDTARPSDGFRPDTVFVTRNFRPGAVFVTRNFRPGAVAPPVRGTQGGQQTEKRCHAVFPKSPGREGSACRDSAGEPLSRGRVYPKHNIFSLPP